MKNKFLIFFILAVFYAGTAAADIAGDDVNQPSFPPAGLSLLATIRAQAGTRRSITVQDQSADNIQLWRDSDCAGTGLSLILLTGSGTGGIAGGYWSSDTFSGCLRVYGPSSGDQVGIWED